MLADLMVFQGYFVAIEICWFLNCFGLRFRVKRREDKSEGKKYFDFDVWL